VWILDYDRELGHFGTVPDRSHGTLDCCTGCAVLYHTAPLAQYVGPRPLLEEQTSHCTSRRRLQERNDLGGGQTVSVKTY
jgi:hypothetical protein